VPLTYTNWLPSVALLRMVSDAFFVFRALPAVGAKFKSETRNFRVPEAFRRSPRNHPSSAGTELYCPEGEPNASVEPHGGCFVVGDGYSERSRNLAAGYAAEVVRRY